MSYWTKKRKIEKTLRDMKAMVSSSMRTEISNYVNISESSCSFNNNTGAQDTGDTDSISSDCTGDASGLNTNFSMSDSDELIDVKFKDNAGECDTNPNMQESESCLSLLLEIWAVEHKITHFALGKLLNLLQKYHPQLPKDPRTLLATSKTFPIHKLAGGEYIHFGVESSLKKQLAINPELQLYPKLHLQINIDGLPLFKSSSSQLWPILATIEEARDTQPVQPFVIGAYYGEHKPNDVGAYLNKFIEDMKSLEQAPYDNNGKDIEIAIRNIVCDAQARVFVKKVKSCAGYSGCDKCTQSGVHTGTKMIFPEVDASLRTDAAFQEMRDEEHHRGRSPFQSLQLGMVTQFPIDYMHLVCLGVTKRLIILWLTGPLDVRIGGRMQSAISESLLGLRAFIPCEFARKPRSLSEIARWKATEFRQFLLYTGTVVLEKNLAEPLFKNFLLLSVAIRILADSKLCKSKSSFAHSLLVAFVQHYSKLFGKNNVVYNIHGLVHLANEVNMFGPLDSFSSFPYESYLYQIKQLVRKPSCVLQQIAARLDEQAKVEIESRKLGHSQKSTSFPQLKNLHCEGPLPCSISTFSKQFKKIVLKDFTLSTNQPDNCFSTDTDVGVVVNIVEAASSDVVIIFRKFCSVTELFDYPCISVDIGISKVSKLSKEFSTCSLSLVKRKVALLPIRNGLHAAFTLIHI